jgi:hypothetical protein
MLKLSNKKLPILTSSYMLKLMKYAVTTNFFFSFRFPAKVALF